MTEQNDPATFPEKNAFDDAKARYVERLESLTLDRRLLFMVAQAQLAQFNILMGMANGPVSIMIEAASEDLLENLKKVDPVTIGLFEECRLRMEESLDAQEARDADG